MRGRTKRIWIKKSREKYYFLDLQEKTPLDVFHTELPKIPIKEKKTTLF
jgi:hypothetical protein